MPLTLDGSSVLHQMFRVRRQAWRGLSEGDRRAIASEASELLTGWEGAAERGSAAFSQIGHKGDLLLVHFRPSFEDLNDAELAWSRLRLADYLEPVSSYLSVVELGLYSSSVQLYQSLLEAGVEPSSSEWVQAEHEKLEEQGRAMAPRLYPSIPDRRYLCFYPMDKRRGEERNWYVEAIEKRERMMRDHGLIGRRYAGKVKQIISGSIGSDDWEWGVDLFADDPLVFKQLIYEMRFDEASAHYALFGPFYIGVRIPAAELAELLDGRRPAYAPANAAAFDE